MTKTTTHHRLHHLTPNTTVAISFVSQHPSHHYYTTITGHSTISVLPLNRRPSQTISCTPIHHYYHTSQNPRHRLYHLPPTSFSIINRNDPRYYLLWLSGCLFVCINKRFILTKGLYRWWRLKYRQCSHVRWYKVRSLISLCFLALSLCFLTLLFFSIFIANFFFVGFNIIDSKNYNVTFSFIRCWKFTVGI